MPSKNNPSKIIQGSLSGIILRLLDENGRMYGYEITKAVRERTSGRLALTEAALYPALHKLLADGLLEAETEIVGGRQRKYYRIVHKREKESTNLIESLRESLKILQNLLHENGTSKA